jgi:phosphoglycolate phosphatase
MLDELVERGCKLAVVSNKPHEATLLLVERLFSRWPFLAVHGQSDDWPLKPDPTLCLDIAAGAGADPAQCLFVGDSNVDMKTGTAAGMHPVGVEWGFRGREELIASGAEAVIAHPRELPPFLEKLKE